MQGISTFADDYVQLGHTVDVFYWAIVDGRTGDIACGKVLRLSTAH